MAVSDLGAAGTPSAALTERLNALFGPCAVVSVMAVCAASSGFTSKLLKSEIGAHAAPYYWPSDIIREFITIFLDSRFLAKALIGCMLFISPVLFLLLYS